MKVEQQTGITSEMILQSLGEGIQCLDLDGYVSFTNPVAARMVGFAVEDLIGRRQHDVMRHSRSDGNLFEFNSCPVCSRLRDGLTHGGDNVNFFRKDDSSFLAEYLCNPIRKGRKLLGVVMSFRDVSQRRREQEALVSLKKAVETMQIGVTITDPDGEILYTNPAEAQMHGYELEEVIGQNVRIFAPRELWDPLTLDEIRKIKSLRRETVNRRKDGTIFPISLTSDAVLNADGDPIAIVSTSENITERKRAEEALRHAYDELDLRVRERTMELTESIALLQEQISKRRH
ncbi:MAG: hypothetical protein C5B54_10625, partial [Acidobacteria bacterium]